MSEGAMPTRSSGRPLARFVETLASIGVGDTDLDLEILRKAAMTLMASRLTLVAIGLSILYVAVDRPLAAVVAVGYAVLTLIGLLLLTLTKKGALFFRSQLALVLVTPYLIAIALGGLESSGEVQLFALISPLLASVVAPRGVWLWFAGYLVLFGALAVADPAIASLAPSVGTDLSRIFFVVNGAAFSWTIFAGLLDFVRRRESTVSGLNELFGLYVPMDIAHALLTDRRRTEMAGTVTDVTAMFADLGGFTGFSEHGSPQRVLELVNRYFAVILPLVRAQGGTVVQYQGDAFLALWNAAAPQPRHALAAARTGLAIQAAIAALPDRDVRAPLFRIGVNTGPAVVGNVGANEFRSFTAIGDAVNVASRLQTVAEPGEVVIGPTTYALIRDLALADSVGRIALKGRDEEIEAFLLRALAD